MGKALNLGAKQLYVGFEYSYWKDKYGIDSRGNLESNQSVASALIKVHF